MSHTGHVTVSSSGWQNGNPGHTAQVRVRRYQNSKIVRWRNEIGRSADTFDFKR